MNLKQGEFPRWDSIYHNSVDAIADYQLACEKYDRIISENWNLLLDIEKKDLLSRSPTEQATIDKAYEIRMGIGFVNLAKANNKFFCDWIYDIMCSIVALVKELEEVFANNSIQNKKR